MFQLESKKDLSVPADLPPVTIEVCITQFWEAVQIHKINDCMTNIFFVYFCKTVKF